MEKQCTRGELLLALCSFCAIGILLLLGAFSDVTGQQALRTFDVVSIRVSKASPNGMTMSMAGNRLLATNITLKSLIMNAYQIRPSEITGGPDWLNNDKFDIDARADSAATAEEFSEMLRVLLERRFQIRVHRESRLMPVYALLVEKGGAKFQKSSDDEKMRVSGGRGRLNLQHASVSDLVRNLSSQIDRNVIDKTELTGTYNFKLEWVPGLSADSDADGPSLFTALKEQLGLRLESDRASLHILVVDGAARPTED